MIRNILLIAAGMLAASTACAQTKISTLKISGTTASTVPFQMPEFSRFLVREHAPFAGFEYDVVNKGFDRKEVYATLWKQALRVCEEQNGYVIEHHRGTKWNVPDRRDAGWRERAYATCALESAPEANAASDLPPPTLTVTGDGMTGDGEVRATGAKRQAYDAARDLVYRTCLDNDRRVEHMSVGFNHSDEDRTQVRFACSRETFGG